MKCLHPIPAWRTHTGEITLRRTERFTARESLKLACGGCLTCRAANARAWAIRCSLEAQEHAQLCWATLTYEEKYKPATLRKDHLSGWLKRLREAVLRRHLPKLQSPGTATGNRIRFFASGEYGEQTQRPHYHAILFGISQDNDQIQKTWPFGHVQVDTLTPSAIAYVAGYTAKKLGWKLLLDGEKVDPDTGEVYTYQPPFIQMSRRPGIGANARQFWRSWRTTAIQDGYETKVPRYLHEAWKAHATQEEIEQLQYEHYLRIKEKTNTTGANEEQLMKNRETNAIQRAKLAATRRDKL